MGWGEYLGGFALFTLMSAGVIAGAVVIGRRRLPHLRGVTRLLAVALVATLGALAVHVVPGALGLLGRGSVLVCTAIWLAAAFSVRAVEREAEPAAELPSGGRVAAALAVVGALLTATFVLAYARDQLVIAPGSVDILNFHLPGVASWIQSGSIWGVHEFVADISPGRYPHNGDVILLAAILPWHSDFLSHLVPYPFIGLAGVATYALAAELGAPRAAAATAGSLLVAIPVVAVPALVNSFPDVIMLFGFATGTLFLLRHRRTQATSDLVLAGLGLGLAFGTKWYGVSAAAAILAVWAGAGLLERTPIRTLLRQGAALVGLILLAGGIWLVRNLIESGNPVHPVEVAPFGLTLFPAPVDVVREAGGFTIAHYLGDGDVWSEYILPQLRDALALIGPLVLAGLALTVVALLARATRARLERRRLAAALCAVALLAAIYSITPYTAGGPEGTPVLVLADARYAVPALLIALAAIAGATRAAPWAPAAFCGLGLVAIVDGLRIAGSAKLSDGVLEAPDWAQALAVMLLIGACLWIRFRAPAGPWRTRGVLVGAALAALAAVCIVGYEVQRSFLADRYRGLDPTTDWIAEHAPANASVGLAGYWTDELSPALPAFGPRFENEVSYVGEFVEGTLRSYRSGTEFKRALRERGIELLVVGRGRPPEPQVREEDWAIEAGYRQVARSATLSLYLRATANTSLPSSSRSGRVDASRVARAINGPSSDSV